MRLLVELRDLVTDPSARLSDILRKAKVLAVTLQQEDIKAWVTHELNGYPAGVDLPSYRCLNSPPLGTFSGVASQVSNFLLPVSQMPEFIQVWARELRMPSSVAEIEALAHGHSNTLRHPWPVEAVQLMRETIVMPGFVLAEAYQPISKAQLEGILDAVRNRLLDFLLAIQELRPDVVDSDEALQAIPRERISDVFHITVHGGQPVIAAGHSLTQQVIQVTPGSLPELVKVFRDLGVDEPDLKELQSAIIEDGDPPKGQPGNRVKTWMSKMMTKAFDGTWKVAISVAAEVIKKSIFAYYGWQ